MSGRMFANSDFAGLGVKKLVGVALFRDSFSTAWVILKGVANVRDVCCKTYATSKATY